MLILYCNICCYGVIKLNFITFNCKTGHAGILVKCEQNLFPAFILHVVHIAVVASRYQTSVFHISTSMCTSSSGIARASVLVGHVTTAT